MRRLVGDDLLSPAATQLAMALYGFAGPSLLRRQLDLLLAGRGWLWSGMAHATRLLLERKAPYRHEPTRVAEPPLLGLDLASGEIRTIIWATGFRPDYS